MKVYSYNSARRFVLAAVVMLLTACGNLAFDKRGVDAQLRTVDVTSTIADIGQMLLLQAHDGRFNVVMQETDLSFNLDPEVTFARFGTPYKQGATLLLPVHIATPHCQNRIVAFVIEDAEVRSFEYLGGNCATHITEVVESGWTAHQKVSDVHTYQWTFDDGKLQRQIKTIARSSSPRHARRVSPAPNTAESKSSAGSSVQTSASSSSPDTEARRLHINLMD